MHRRNAEIAWFNTPDHVEPPAAPDPEIVWSPKALPPKTIAKSKTAAAAGSIFSFSLAEAMKALNDLLEPIKQAKGSLTDLGLWESVSAAAHDPRLLLCAAVAGLCVFIFLDRRSKLLNDHV